MPQTTWNDRVQPHGTEIKNPHIVRYVSERRYCHEYIVFGSCR
jgi:hypothetical protein